MAVRKISINRAPVLTLWAAIVANRSGHDWSEALTLGRALAGLNAQSKGQRLGIYEKKEKKGKETPSKAAAERPQSVSLMGREVPVMRTGDGLRALSKDEAIHPPSVQKYLEQKFGDDLDPARSALEALAQSFSPAQLQERAYALYETFRPKIPEGKKGWGAKGELDLDLIRSLRK
jgi:hypothetical protein